MTIEQFQAAFPDWQDKSQYPSPEQCSLSQWAWEFLRRNPQYQADYAALELETDRGVRGRISLQTGLAYGLTGAMIDPRTSAGVLSGPIFLNRTPRIIRAYKRPYQFASFEAAVIIDLRLPIDGQLDLAKSALYDVQFQRTQTKECEPVESNTRARSDKYSGYLRVLDAKNTGNVTFQQIAEKVFPHLKDNSGAKLAGTAYKAAVALRDGGYRSLPLLKVPSFHDEPENVETEE